MWKADKYTDKLHVRVIDQDGGPIGAAVSAFLLNQTHLHYFNTEASKFPTMGDIQHDVVQEGAWGSVVIASGASAALEQARASGNSSYNPRDAVRFVYAQARSETAIGSYLLPNVQSDLTQITAKFSAQNVAQFLSANSGNATAITNAAKAPQTISGPVSFTLDNIRPYNQPVATAITLVGLIYMVIFAFVQVMANNAAREIIAPYLTTAAYIRYRLIAPIVQYFFVSLLFAMVNLPFKIHFGAHFTYAGGFFLWWIVLWLGMISVGYAMEFFITILGPKFVSYALLAVIISNVSVVTLPHELQPWIFRYGVAMPFYNCSKIVRTIIFDTKDTIGMNIGILIAWIAVSCITIPLLTWLLRRTAINEHRRNVAENELDTKLPDGRVV